MFDHSFFQDEKSPFIKKEICLGCIDGFEPGQLLSLSLSQKYISLFLEDHSNKAHMAWQQDAISSYKIEQPLCALLNKKVGYLFLGLQSTEKDRLQYKIKGIKLNEKKKMDFIASVRNTVSKLLMPKEELSKFFADFDQFDSLIQIRFIPVKCSQADNLFVIRIKINGIKKLNQKTLFFVNVLKLGSQDVSEVSSYILEKGEVKQLDNRLVNSQIQRMVRTSKRREIVQGVLYKHSPNIKCRQLPFQKPTFYQTNQKNKSIFQSQKKYNFESLILFPKSERENLENLFCGLREKKTLYHSEQLRIIESSWSPRGVVYISHQKNYEKFNSIFRQVSGPNMLIFNVRKNLVLLNFNDSNNAFSLINSAFKTKFSCNFCYGQKKGYNPKLKQNVQQSFFQFETKMQAIFAFVLLEQHNLKSNFVNQAKAEGTFWQIF